MRGCVAPVVLALLAAACDRRAPASSAAAPAGSAPAVAPGPVTAALEDAAPTGTPCGPLSCAQFDSAADALRAAIGPWPAVLAVGEAHAQRGATAPSAAHRFTTELLPVLAGHASDLLVELMMPPRGCADAAAEVRERQAPATSAQAPTNQNEYVTMGERARALGIVPDLLRPSCADLAGVADAGDGAIQASLEMIARLTRAQATRMIDRDERSDGDRGKTVVVYGGLLHNDLDPAPDRAAWSYAPALDARVGGRLIAVDLVVPEFITDEATWRALPWTASYDRARLGARTTLLRTGERSFVLVFAETR